MAASHIMTSLGLSVRKSCLLVDLSRTAYGYQSHREDDSVLRHRLRELAAERKRFRQPAAPYYAQERRPGDQPQKDRTHL